MENLPIRIGEFIGASAIYAPLTLALIWFIRWTMKGADWPHWYKTAFSCVIVSAALLALSLPKFDKVAAIEEQVWISVWLLVGLFAWRPKPHAYYFRNEYVTAWETFRDNPTVENAQALLEIAPPLLRYFEDCTPGTSFYKSNAFLKKYDVKK